MIRMIRMILIWCLLAAAPALGQLPHRVSVYNSSTTNLTAGATFTGGWERCDAHNTITVAVTSNTDGTLLIQFANDDGSNKTVLSTLTYKIKAGRVEPPHSLQIYRKYCRVTFTNTGASTQTQFDLLTRYSGNTDPVSPLNAGVHLDADAQVTRAISTEFMIGTGQLIGVTKINKFGQNLDVDEPEDIIEQGGTYAGFPTGTAELVEVVSSGANAANDDLGGTGCEKLTIEGLSANYEVQTEVITLDGTTPVDSVNTYKRVYRAYCSQSNNGANDSFNAGTILVRWTTTTSVVFASIAPGTNQSRVCAYTIPANSTGYLRDFGVSVAKNNSAVVTGSLWFASGGVGVSPPRKIRPFTASNSESIFDYIYSAIAFPEKTDIKVTIDAVSTTNVTVTCNMDIFIVEN